MTWACFGNTFALGLPSPCFQYLEQQQLCLSAELLSCRSSLCCLFSLSGLSQLPILEQPHQVEKQANEVEPEKRNMRRWARILQFNDVLQGLLSCHLFGNILNEFLNKSYEYLSRSWCPTEWHVLHEGGHDVNGDGEDDGAVVLRWDVVQRLQLSTYM